MRRTRLSLRYTKVCSRCGANTYTKKENEEGLCKRCQEEYKETMFAIYGDE